MSKPMTGSQDLESLVRKAGKGDRHAFGAAISACRGNLEGFVKTRLGPHLRQYVEVADVLQDTYAQALTSVSHFHWTGDASFVRWLHGIAEHVMLNLARRQRRRQGKILYLERDAPHDGPAPSTAMRRGERLDRLRGALDSLDPEHREAIYLVRIRGLKVKEAAQHMNRTPKAVMHLLARGLKKLKDSFGDTESLNLPHRTLERSEDHSES